MVRSLILEGRVFFGNNRVAVIVVSVLLVPRVIIRRDGEVRNLRLAWQANLLYRIAGVTLFQYFVFSFCLCAYDGGHVLHLIIFKGLFTYAHLFA